MDSSFKVLLQALFDKSKLTKEFADIKRLAEALDIKVKASVDKSNISKQINDISAEIAKLFNKKYNFNINAKDIQSAIKAICKDQEKLNKLLDSKKLAEQLNYYKTIQQNIQAIYNLKMKLPNADKNETTEIQKQIQLLEKRNQYYSKQINKNGLKDNSLEWELNRTIDIYQKRLAINAAKISDISNRKSKIIDENNELKNQLTLQSKIRLELQKANVKSGIDAFISQNSKLKGTSNEARVLYNRFIELRDAVDRVDDTKSLTNLKTQLTTLKNEVKSTGLVGKNFGDSIKNALSGVTTWISATTIFFRVVRTIKEAISTVYKLDTALVDLKKTTNASARELASFYLEANKTAKNLGVTTEAIITQASAWSRLGYSIKDAKIMAENSAIFKSISPGMDIEKSTDGLVSTLKAFKIEASDALDGVISKVNIIGNTQAVENQDIVDILTRSSAAMSEANNTLEQTISLGTAATEITRDADSVGTALKTISMRLRGKRQLPPYNENYMLCT